MRGKSTRTTLELCLEKYGMRVLLAGAQGHQESETSAGDPRPPHAQLGSPSKEHAGTQSRGLPREYP